MSNVWNYFSKVKDPITGKTTHGKCNSCSKDITNNGTSSLRTHAKTHGIVISSEKNSHSTATTTLIEIVQPSITNYFPPINKDSLDALLAKLCAKRGLSFSVVASEEIADLVSKAGYEKMPRSPNTIKRRVMSFAEIVKDSYVYEISNELKNARFLSVGFDEWTSMANERYMNVILYSPDKSWNLGLIRVKGKTNATLLTNDLKTKLAMFNVSISNLICIMSDGAAINKRMSQDADMIQQECLSHGVQLAVKKTFYNNGKDVENESDNSDSEDDDPPDDELGLMAWEEISSEKPNFKELNINEVVKKVRQLVRYFNKSPVRNDHLSEIIKANFSNSKKLIRDSVTRWNSLNHMLTRFYKLRESINEVLPILLNKKTILTFSEDEYLLIGSIIETLTPVEQCVQSLCREDCTLYEAHLSIEVALDELSELNSFFAINLKKFMIEKLSSRFSNLYYLQVYLEDSTLVNSPKYFKSMPDKDTIFTNLFSVFCEINKEDIMCNDSIGSGNEPNQSENQKSTKSSFYEKIAEKKSKSKLSQKSPENQLVEQLRMYEQTGSLGNQLKKILDCTKSVRPTTTDCERTFSVAGFFCNKLRSRLGSETLSNLVILKSFFNQS